MFSILTICNGSNISECCKDYTLVPLLAIIKHTFQIMQIIVPVLLIVSCIISFTKLLINPEDKKAEKGIVKKFMAAIIVFFLPTIVSLALAILPYGNVDDNDINTFDVATCLTNIDELSDKMTAEVTYDDPKGNKIVYDSSDYNFKPGTYENNDSDDSIDYVSWMIKISKDNSHGYSMSNRNFNPDVDCASFVYYALLNNGYTKKQLGTYAFTTDNMGGILKKIGFKEIKFSTKKLKIGDIFVRPKSGAYGHTGVYVGNNQSVEAHGSNGHPQPGDQGGEITVGNMGNNYNYIYRKE